MGGSSWREGDLRGDGSRPASVVDLVRRTHLSLSVARWGESVLLGATGFCLTMAALTVSLAGEAAAARIESAERLWVAVLGGVLAGAVWRLEHDKSREDVARELDRKLRHGGALVTAFELEGRAGTTSREPREPRSPMVSLLLERVMERLRYREALRAMFPSVVIPVAAPFLAAAVLAWSHDLVSAERRLSQRAALSEGMVGGFGEMIAKASAAQARGALDPALFREMTELRGEVGALGRRLTDPEAAASAVADEIDELDRRLSSLSPALATDPAIDRELGRLRSWLDAARMELALHDESPAGEMSGSGSAAGPGTATPDRGDLAGGPTGGSGPTPVPADGSAPGVSPESAGAFDPSPEETGAGIGRWWRPEYDAVVERWIDSRRRALEARPGPGDGAGERTDGREDNP